MFATRAGLIQPDIKLTSEQIRLMKERARKDIETHKKIGELRRMESALRAPLSRDGLKPGETPSFEPKSTTQRLSPRVDLPRLELSAIEVSFHLKLGSARERIRHLQSSVTGSLSARDARPRANSLPSRLERVAADIKAAHDAGREKAMAAEKLSRILQSRFVTTLNP